MIKTEAKRLGFLSCGISKAGFLEEEAPRLENWLHQNRHGEMHYMENHFDMRIDPSKLVPGAKSVITLLLNYFPVQHQNSITVEIKINLQFIIRVLTFKGLTKHCFVLFLPHLIS